ncbi:MAG: hypothetical protein EU550_03655 [Promethearchaeota archaeon]|nr:MAG: hypothetical protein EU550_03655 [Candidatus Lokiarchaeota archaeon]
MKKTDLFEIINTKIHQIPFMMRVIVFLRRKLKIPLLAPHKYLKETVIKKHARRFSLDILIETGTADGEMVQATKNIFKKIYSVELDEALYKYSKNRFAYDDHIFLYQGDSSKILPVILSKIKKPCLFWLDAHYSGGETARGSVETPIMTELNYIFDTKLNHVILIDDAKLFVGKNDYPTIKEVKNLLMKKNSNWFLEIKYDIIRIRKRIK